MALPAGERFGPYEILALIGAGGIGEVYKPRDTRLDRIVAIKVSKENFIERFEREARAVAALNHPISARCMTRVPIERYRAASLHGRRRLPLPDQLTLGASGVTSFVTVEAPEPVHPGPRLAAPSA
jgi:serine/threonine protein kinase